MLTSLRMILSDTPETETFLVQIETLFISHFNEKHETAKASGSSHFHDLITQSPLHTSISEPADDGAVLDFEEMYMIEEKPSAELDKGFNDLLQPVTIQISNTSSKSDENSYDS